MLRQLGLALLIVAVAFEATVSAQEAPPTAVAPFEGRLAPTMRRAVERALEDEADLVDSDRASGAAEEAGVSGLEDTGVSAMASSTGAQLVVQGNVGGSRRAQTVELVVRAADGAELARGQVTYRRGRQHAARFERGVQRVFAEAVTALASHSPAQPEQAEAPPSEEAVAPAPAAERPDDGLALLSVLAALTIRGRDARVDVIGMPPRLYSPEYGVYAELGLAFEARPFANEAHLGRGVFINGAFGHSVGLGSRVSSPACDADPTQPGCSVTTNFLRFQIGAGWLAPIGDIVELGVGIAGGLDGYYLSPNSVLPTAEYGYIRPGARGRFRIVKEALVVEAEVAYRGVFTVGEMATRFGETYGAHGVDIGIGLTGNLIPVMDIGFAWGVRFDWVGYFLSFAGPADEPATGGNESSVRILIHAGWAFR